MTLRVGFLGHRFMGRAHANALARLPMFFPDAPETERAVLVGRDEAALAEHADRLGFAETETDWQDAIGRVDVLYNLAPNFLHVEPSVAALERGVHVLCEKPMAPRLGGAERMAEAARSSDAVAGVGFNYRFVPAIQLARELIAGGELGEVRQVRGRYLQDWLVDPEAPWSWRNDEELAGSGALGDLGAHAFDLAGFLVGDAPGGGAIEQVSGHLRTFVEERPVAGGAEDGGVDGDGGDAGAEADAETHPVTVDDAFSAQVAYEGGAMGTFEASRVAPGHANDHVIAVHGTEGSLRFSLERLNELEVRRPDGRGYETVLVTDESDPYVDAWWPPGHVLGWEHTFVHESHEFLSAVGAAEAGSGVGGSGEGRFRPDFEDGLAVQRAIDAVERSDAGGEWVVPGDRSSGR